LAVGCRQLLRQDPDDNVPWREGRINTIIPVKSEIIKKGNTKLGVIIGGRQVDIADLLQDNEPLI